MSDIARRLTRRTAIKRSAIAAGVVWSVPTVRTVRLLAAAGSPAPTTTSGNTVPTITEFQFSGTTDGATTSGSTVQTIDVDVVGVGPATATLEITAGSSHLVPPNTVQTVFEGELLLETADGSIHGTGFGFGQQEIILVPPNNQIVVLSGSLDLDLTITSGEGRFAGATGAASYTVSENESGATGELSGSFGVPS